MEALLWILGVGLSIALVHFKTRRSILLANISFCLVMFFSCLLQQAHCLAYINLISIGWILVCLYPVTARYLQAPANVFVSICLLAVVVFPMIYAGVTDLIILLAFSMGRFAETLKSPQNMRWVYLVCQTSWISYACIESLELQLLTGTISIVSILCSLYAENRRTLTTATAGKSQIKQKPRLFPAFAVISIPSPLSQSRLRRD